MVVADDSSATVAESALPTTGGQVTGTHFHVLRQQLLRRRLHALGAVQRVSAVALMCSTVLAMTLVALVVFDRSPIGPIPRRLGGRSAASWCSSDCFWP